LPSEPDKATEMEQFIARISTEFVLAYAIHKTLLLPLRAGITIAITPAFVRWLVRRGWARPVKNTASAASKQF
ncbi:FAM210A/B-like domain-containing protein, partial [Staphylococcus aureus]|uniref:FAM210A/B-like domain-containing protein n=1 Tax=Staphylococcus aureus TaxID=1280 RepID=UPI003D143A53